MLMQESVMYNNVGLLQISLQSFKKKKLLVTLSECSYAAMVSNGYVHPTVHKAVYMFMAMERCAKTLISPDFYLKKKYIYIYIFSLLDLL